jgi:hypothetical protein
VKWEEKHKQAVGIAVAVAEHWMLRAPTRRTQMAPTFFLVADLT